ncbi:MAG: hypothetical protein KatS3mg056_0012 [Chloroflexus sp.]|nr:MAG: hypothetical protein KatS3mg056_0012 [Chloroflexus sp.]
MSTLWIANKPFVPANLPLPDSVERELAQFATEMVEGNHMQIATRQKEVVRLYQPVSQFLPAGSEIGDFNRIALANAFVQHLHQFGINRRLTHRAGT